MSPRSLALLALIGLAAFPAMGQGADPVAVRDEAALAAAIERWLFENPETLRRAVEAALAREAAAQDGRIDPMDGILGNPQGDATLFLFIDRASPHSRAAMPLVAALAATDPGLKVVIKELPLLSQASVAAASAAVAVRRHGEEAFRIFETTLIAEPGEPDEVALARAAAAAGVDAASLASGRAEPSVLDYLKRTRALAARLGVEGTPAFIVGNRGLAGLQNIDNLRAAIAEARERGR